jgi:hypothetical protein
MVVKMKLPSLSVITLKYTLKKLRGKSKFDWFRFRNLLHIAQLPKQCCQLAESSAEELKMDR